MTENLINQYRQAVQPLLEQGERLLDVATVTPVAGASGVGDGAGAAIGNKLARIGAVSGGHGSIASGFPASDGVPTRRLLVVTDRRAAVVIVPIDIRKPSRLVWHAPRHLVQRVERRPRLQLMARFRLHFADGSAVALMTMRRRTVEALADQLGR
ncbi:hypothetical protein [Streptomyces sp. NRRL WC-3742]|uniref:hypothetical protein n=1 Tax=Streptomyces sp. NRRL WC-3742 TaxID=1463934 RepID=UPI0004CBED57|nr:hypothetical protein [Streptomyces sp. NRRL WC-3742]